jgi:fructosamine-3-kinase
VRFFVEKRLQPLVDQCLSRQLLFPEHRKKFERLNSLLAEIFNEEQKPAFLHGDLWSGNFMCSENSEPVLIDPAVYYGHPSVDLGMTTLFGGFAPAFYDAYNYHSPFPKNHKQQWQACNLYPLLIHLLLFGRSYLSQIDFTLKQLAG